MCTSETAASWTFSAAQLHSFTYIPPNCYIPSLILWRRASSQGRSNNMKPSENTHGTSVVQVSERHVSFSDQVNDDQSSQSNVPLLLQPSYARSKSSIYDELRNFRISLKWCALDHSSTLGKFISYLTFLLLTVMVPIISSTSIKLPDTFPEENPISMNKVVQLPESGLAAIGFFTLARFFMRYGLRQLLFLDGLREDSQYVRRGYARELEKAFRYLACILLPSFFVEFTHKVLLFSTVTVSSSSSSSIIILPPYIVGSAEIPLAKAAVFVMVLGSWVYRTGVFLLVCVLFRLTCELQILRLEGLRKIFEEGCSADADVIFREHVRIRQQLSVTSHRYRFFIIGCLVTITLSQLGELILVVASKSEKNFFTSGDLVVRPRPKNTTFVPPINRKVIRPYYFCNTHQTHLIFAKKHDKLFSNF